MKFYYNLSDNLLQSYFNFYLEVINNAFPWQYELRQIARPLIRPQTTRFAFTESTIVFQLIQLLTYTHTIQKYLNRLNTKRTHIMALVTTLKKNISEHISVF